MYNTLKCEFCSIMNVLLCHINSKIAFTQNIVFGCTYAQKVLRWALKAIITVKTYFTQPIEKSQVSLEKRVHYSHIVTIDDMSFVGKVLQISWS